MYAVIESGGKQHRVTEGEVLKLEKIEASTGDKIDFEHVLMLGEGADVQIGTPYVKSGKVTAEVISHGRGAKVKIIKFQRRKHHQKQMGHRQWFTEVKITKISTGTSSGTKAKAEAAPEKSAAPKKAAPKKAAPEKKAAPKKAAPKKAAADKSAAPKKAAAEKKAAPKAKAKAKADPKK